MKIMVKIPILSIFYYDIVIELHVCTKQGRPRLTAVAIKKYTMALLNRNALIQRFLTGSCMLRSLWYPSPQGLRCGPERVEEALMASAHDECQGLGLAATRLGRRAFFVRSSTGRFKELAPNERTIRVNAGMALLVGPLAGSTNALGALLLVATQREVPKAVVPAALLISSYFWFETDTELARRFPPWTACRSVQPLQPYQEAARTLRAGFTRSSGPKICREFLLSVEPAVRRAGAGSEARAPLEKAKSLRVSDRLAWPKLAKCGPRCRSPKSQKSRRVLE